MCKRIYISYARHCFLLLALLLLTPVAAFAQVAQPDNNVEQAAGQLTSTVTASATAERVRFTSPNTVVQMHLQVYDNGGQLVFDVSSKGNVLDWTLQDGGGARLNPGSYLSVITVKSLSGKLSQRIGSVAVQDKQIELERVEATQMTAGQQQAVGPIEENSALTILQAGETEAATVVAHDGTQGEVTRSRGALSFRLGDFFSGKDEEQMRLTEEGNLGIGTDSPQAKLDVAGVIRTSKGIEFANSTDGTGTNVTKLTATASGTLQQTLANGSVVTTATGTGTLDRLAKWAETGGAGTLTDSVITETGGKVGIGVTNPTYRLVVGPDIGPGLTTSDLTVSRGPGQSVSIFAGATGAHGMNFGWDESNLRAFVNAPVESPITFTHGGVSERMRIEINGNVGIGTTIPTAKLDVAGNINTSTQFNIGGNRVLSVAGTRNVFAGAGAGQNNTTGFDNSFFGGNAGLNNIDGNFNSFFGAGAGRQNTTINNVSGFENSFFGYQAGSNNTTGGNNVIVGTYGGFSNTTESSNTFIGGSANGAAGITNATAIGANASVSQSNSLVLGNTVNVGIGTTAPLARLHVANGSICAGPYCNDFAGRITAGGNLAEITFLDRGATSFVSAPANGERWTWYGTSGRARLWSGADKLSVDPSGNLRVLGAVTASTTPDIAETIPADGSVTEGDVVCADRSHSERAIRCSKNDRAILGVISDGSGGFLINSRGGSLDAPLTGKPLVLAGRVPVKVSLENGPIRIGDLLTPSSTPGVAMRATETGPTIGIALEAFGGETVNGRGQTATVLCFLKTGDGNPATALTRMNAENARLQQQNVALKARLDRLERTVGTLQPAVRQQRARKRRS